MTSRKQTRPASARKSGKPAARARRARRTSSGENLEKPELTAELEPLLEYATNLVALKVAGGEFTERGRFGAENALLLQACLTVRIERPPPGWQPSEADRTEYDRQSAAIAARDDMTSDEMQFRWQQGITWGLLHHMLYWRRLPDAVGDGPATVAPFDVEHAIASYHPYDVRSLEFDDDGAKGVIELAWKGHPGASAVLSYFVDYFRHVGQWPPPNLAQYVTDRVNGREVRAPKGRKKTGARDFEIAVLVNDILKTGIQQSAARKPLWGRPSPNAYWLAHLALEANGIKETEPVIEAAWRAYGSVANEVWNDIMDYELVGIDGSVVLSPRTFLPELSPPSYLQLVQS